MLPPEPPASPPEPRHIGSLPFDSTDNAHQAALLSAATRFLAEGTPLALRMAGMNLLDYHQSLLREAASIVQLDAKSKGDIPPLLNLLRDRIPGMERRSWDHLIKLRDTIYHNEFRHPIASDLEVVLEGAPIMRRYVLGAANAALARQSVMSRLVQRLLATALEMKRELPTGNKEWQAPWVPKIERALELTKISPTALTDEGVELLLELTKGVEASRTYDRIKAAEQGDEFDAGLDYSDFEPDQNEPPIPEPDEFDPSEYYAEPPDQEPAEEEPPDQRPPDQEPPDQEPPDQG